MDDPWKDYPSKKALYGEYSRWSVGLNVGMPFYAGDFRSVSRGNNNWAGYMVGLQGGYQFNPAGTRLSVDFGNNKAGSQSYEDGFVLLPDGNTYYNSDFPQGAAYYRDLYSSVNSLNVGLNAEINLVNLFRRSDGERRWAVIAAPGIYMQKFWSEVKNRADDSRFAEKIDQKINLGIGGDVAVRYRVNRHVDVQLKGGMIWINNQDFDGIKSVNTTKHNSMVTAQAGIVWKIGNRRDGGKKDNLMYAPGYLPMWKRATKTVTKVVRDTIYIEKKVIEKSPEVAVVKGFPEALPAVYFERGKWKLDTDKYALELFTIAKAMKDNPDVNIDIYGYADHTGGKAINEKVTRKRAEALKKWLESVGIEGHRINTYGLGKDMTIEKSMRYSVKARRSEVKNKK